MKSFLSPENKSVIILTAIHHVSKILSYASVTVVFFSPKNQQACLSRYRYGKIQKVIINPAKEQKDEKDTTRTATVAFTDIKSASNAHKAEKKIGNNVLTSEYSEGFAASGTLVKRTHEPEVYPRPPQPGYPTNRKG